MRIEMTVRWQYEERRVVWQDGKVSSEPIFLAYLQAWAKGREGSPIGLPAGRSVTSDYLADPTAFTELVAEVAEVVAYVTDIPPISSQELGDTGIIF